jgi:hypothetical protein
MTRLFSSRAFEMHAPAARLSSADQFAQTASAILFQVQKAAVACAKEQEDLELSEKLGKLLAEAAARMATGAARNLSPREASRDIMVPLVKLAEHVPHGHLRQCGKAVREARRRTERMWKRMRHLASKSSSADRQWNRLAGARSYSTDLRKVARNGWILSVLYALGLLGAFGLGSRSRTPHRSVRVNLLIQNLVQMTQSEMHFLAHEQRKNAQHVGRAKPPKRLAWLRRNARALAALSPLALLLSIPSVARKFALSQPHGADARQALWNYTEHGTGRLKIPDGP